MKSTWHHCFGHELQEDNSPHTHKAVKGTFIFLLQPYFDQLDNYLM